MGLRIFSVRTFVMLALVMTLVVAAHGFAASNTVSVTGAGDGANDISGYTIGAVSYTLNSTNPQTVDKVSFTVTPIATANGTPATPTSVKARVTSSGSFFDCSNSSGTTWSCPSTGTLGISATSANQLQIVASQ